MTNVKVVTGLRRLRDPELDTMTQVVINKMTGNVNFPNPIPALADIQTAHDEFQKALAFAMEGGKDRTFIKNRKRDALSRMLLDLSMYVQLNCKGDEVIALSSGFSTRKQRATVGVLSKPANLKIENGYNPGSVIVSVAKVAKAGSYIFEYTAAPVAPTSQWTAKAGMSRKLFLEGFTSGTTYAFRVGAVGAHPTVVYSDIITRVVV